MSAFLLFTICAVIEYTSQIRGIDYTVDNFITTFGTVPSDLASQHNKNLH